jgi:DNA-binding NtrC family response regulator
MLEGKRTIIIVDDDRSILRVFTRVLEKKGYTVTTAENGKAALNQIECNRFDAALIDVRLPDMEGTAILPRIQETSPKTVKIIFTGSPDLEVLGNGANKNMDAFLLKPVKPEVLLGILDEKIKARIAL